METVKQTTFQDALDMVESLPRAQQSDLIEIIGNRLVEARRDEMARNIKKTRAAHRAGQLTTGSAEDLMAELRG